MSKLLELEEDKFIARFQQQVQKAREIALHDKHIKWRVFEEGDWALLYDGKYFKHPGKLWMHWLGPFVIQSIPDARAIQLDTLQGELYGGLINGSRLKLSKDNLLPSPRPL